MVWTLLYGNLLQDNVQQSIYDLIFMEPEIIFIKRLYETFGEMEIKYINIQQIMFFRKMKSYKFIWLGLANYSLILKRLSTDL